MHSWSIFHTHPTAMPPWTSLSLSIWPDPSQFPHHFCWYHSWWVPTLLWSHFSFSFCSCSILCPSDLCGAGRMYHKWIHSTPKWHGEHPRYDTVFIETNPELSGMQGMAIGHVFLFFSLTFWDVLYPCTLIHWHSLVRDGPDKDTRLWVVKLEFKCNSHCNLAVVHLESIAQGAHLIGVYSSAFLPEGFHFSYSLDVFHAYFVNCYADHHTHKFLTSANVI